MDITRLCKQTVFLIVKLLNKSYNDLPTTEIYKLINNK